MKALIDHCRSLLSHPVLSIAALEQALQLDIDRDSLLAHVRVDFARPYGRSIFFQTNSLEGMVATWTRGMACAPHTHGRSVGSIRVMQGIAIHTLWRVCAGELTPVHEESLAEGSVASLGLNVIHSVADGGGTEPLLTLHLYSTSIDQMVVYDLERKDTVIVAGRCGAWIPYDSPQYIQGIRSGFHAPKDIASWAQERAIPDWSLPSVTSSRALSRLPGRL